MEKIKLMSASKISKIKLLDKNSRITCGSCHSMNLVGNVAFEIAGVGFALLQNQERVQLLLEGDTHPLFNYQNGEWSFNEESLFSIRGDDINLKHCEVLKNINIKVRGDVHLNEGGFIESITLTVEEVQS